MSVSCLNILDLLKKSIDHANLELIDNMTQPDMNYGYACIKPNLTYEYFFRCIKKHWETIINDFINQPGSCSTKLSDILGFYKYATPENISHIRSIFSGIDFTDEGVKSFNIQNINLDNVVLDVIATSLMHSGKDNTFVLKMNFVDSMTSLGQILVENCQCQIVDIYKFFVQKYGSKYQKKFAGKTKNEVIASLRSDYNDFKQAIIKLTSDDRDKTKINFMDGITNNLTGLYSFSIEGELGKLIPADLGSLKDFFIQVISRYYNNLHPIIWAQIFKGVVENIFIELPLTHSEFFSFFSKQLLLKSGPFILKILQMIRPFLSTELAKKYNLTKLTYPTLAPNQIDLMLKRVVYDWDMYQVLENFSASVGHVSKVMKVNDPANPFMIKMIKPLAIAQSCWEYKTLYNVFEEGTCEQTFIKNILESNGSELNVSNEIININQGYKHYTEKYSNIFPANIDVMLTTIQNIPGIIRSDCWYALTMTIAPGSSS